MISRRTLLAAPLALSAQTRRGALVILWSRSRSLPDALADASVVFPRAYTACPQEAAARRALETGRFPHASRASDPTLESELRRAGWTYRLAPADTREEAIRLLAATPPEAVVVFAAAPVGSEDLALERAVHLPLALRWPGLLAPKSAAEILLSHADLMPTLLALAGVDPPEGVQGRNLAPLLRGERAPLPDAVYVEGSAGARTSWRALIRGFDKLVFNLREEVLGMYNVEDDPQEQTNLAREASRNPSLKLERDGLLALARVWMRKLEDGRDSSGARTR